MQDHASFSIRSSDIRVVSSLREGLRTIWAHRLLLGSFVVRDVVSSKRGSLLGLLWLVLTPLFLMVLYSFVFGIVFGGRYGTSADETGADYALGIFVSLIVFQVFSESMSRSPTIIVSSPTLVKKVVFPLEILPLSVVGAQLVQFAVSLLLVVIGALLVGDGVLLTWLWLPIILVPVILLAAGTAWFFAAVGVYLRDLAEVTRVLSTVLLFGSAVFYSLDRLPEVAQYVLTVNPLVHALEQVRGAMLWGRVPEPLGLAYLYVSGGLAFVVGLKVFARLRQDFADVL